MKAAWASSTLTCILGILRHSPMAPMAVGARHCMQCSVFGLCRCASFELHEIEMTAMLNSQARQDWRSISLYIAMWSAAARWILSGAHSCPSLQLWSLKQRPDEPRPGQDAIP